MAAETASGGSLIVQREIVATSASAFRSTTGSGIPALMTGRCPRRGTLAIDERRPRQDSNQRWTSRGTAQSLTARRRGRGHNSFETHVKHPSPSPQRSAACSRTPPAAALVVDWLDNDRASSHVPRNGVLWGGNCSALVVRPHNKPAMRAKTSAAQYASAWVLAMRKVV